jgi:hypothetical protein
MNQKLRASRSALAAAIGFACVSTLAGCSGSPMDRTEETSSTQSALEMPALDASIDPAPEPTCTDNCGPATVPTGTWKGKVTIAPVGELTCTISSVTPDDGYDYAYQVDCSKFGFSGSGKVQLDNKNQKVWFKGSYGPFGVGVDVDNKYDCTIAPGNNAIGYSGTLPVIGKDRNVVFADDGTLYIGTLAGGVNTTASLTKQ